MTKQTEALKLALDAFLFLTSTEKTGECEHGNVLDYEKCKHCENSYINKAITAIRTALDEPSGWQPIETAPKDGTVILIFEPRLHYNSIEKASWKTDPNEVFNDEDAKPENYDWRGEDGDDWSVGLYYCCYSPTHWMPLPPPPAGE